MRYNFVLFDLDGTLFDYEKAEKIAFEKTFGNFGLQNNLSKLNREYRLINEKIWQDFQNGKISATKLRTERFRILCDKEKLKILPEELSENYLQNLAGCSFLLDGALETVSYFCQKCKLALITNGLADVQHSRIENSPLKNYFQDIFISEEIGIAKPDVRIFEHIFSQFASYEKTESLIVGDSLSSDISGGINFGIDTCWFNPNGLNNETEFVPAYEISALKELREIIS